MRSHQAWGVGWGVAVLHMPSLVWDGGGSWG